MSVSMSLFLAPLDLLATAGGKSRKVSKILCHNTATDPHKCKMLKMLNEKCHTATNPHNYKKVNKHVECKRVQDILPQHYYPPANM